MKTNEGREFDLFFEQLKMGGFSYNVEETGLVSWGQPLELWDWFKRQEEVMCLGHYTNGQKQNVWLRVG